MPDLNSRRGGVAVVAMTLALWFAVMGAAAMTEGYSPVVPSTWSRWDSANYVQIAATGYQFEHCGEQSWFTPDKWCGLAGWFPGFPYMIKAASWTGLDRILVGWLIAAAAMVVGSSS